MLDLALLSANAAQLKFILTNWDHLNFREILLSLVITSIFLQVNLFINQLKKNRKLSYLIVSNVYFIFQIFQAVVCVVLGLVFNINKVDQQKSAEIINNISVSIAVIVVTLNVVISAFDIKNTSDKKVI